MALLAGVSNVRVIVSVIIILGCFITIYPKFFHPVVMKIFGFSSRDSGSQKQRNIPPRPHRPEREPGVPPASPSGMPPNMDDIHRHMRNGPHPGMRAAAEMNRQQSKTGSGGRGGMMGMVLPVYAVGIIGYLIYTLVKVFNKKGNYEKKRGYYGRGRESSSEERSQEAPDLNELQDNNAKLTELENLLSKADDKNISAEEMRALQIRLEETEKQMSRILSAMQTVSTRITTNVQDDKEISKTEEGDTKPTNEGNPKSSDSKVKNTEEEEKSEGIPKSDEPEKQSEPEEQSEITDKTEEEEEVVLLDKKKEEEEEPGVRQRKVHTDNIDNRDLPE